MPEALSQDLPLRVLTAIDADLSRRGAAARFGVSAANAICWAAWRRTQGNTWPKALGGNRRSERAEAQAKVIMGRQEAKPDITLAEIRAALGSGASRWV